MKKRRYLNLFVFGSIAILVISLFFFIYSYSKHQDQKSFEADVLEKSNQLSAELKRKEVIIKSFKGFFLSSAFVNKEEWDKFVNQSANLSESENISYLLFLDENNSSLAKDYKIDKHPGTKIIYSSDPEFTYEMGDLNHLQKIKKSEIIHIQKLFPGSDRDDFLFIYPYQKGIEKGCFILSCSEFMKWQVKGIHSSINSNNNLIFTTSTTSPIKETNKKVSFAGSDYELTIWASKYYQAKHSRLPYLLSVSFTIILILILLIHLQYQHNKDRVEMSSQILDGRKKLLANQKILETLNMSTAHSSGDEFFAQLTKELAKAFDSQHCFISQVKNESTITTLSAYCNGEHIENCDFALEGAPCKLVIDKGFYHQKTGLKNHFKHSDTIEQLNANSYLGQAIKNSNGDVIGIICLIDNGEILLDKNREVILNIFASRSAMEMERMDAYKRLERSREELEKAKDEALEASSAKSNFLATMSHEIRTPMNGVLGMVDLLSETKLDHTQSQYTDIIKTSAENLLVILNDILDFSKLESGKFEIRHEPFSIRKMILEIYDTYYLQVKDKDLSMELELDIGDIDMLIGDDIRIKQILINLMSNALKFTEKGSITLSVKESHSQGQFHNIEFMVKDTGIGMSEDQCKVIFERFVQADESTTRKYGGTGLGLSISQFLCELMDGSISVQSEIDKGSTFIMHLNLRKSDLSLEDDIEKTVEAELEEARILLAEDDITNQQIASLIFERLGYQCEIVTNGKEALQRFKETDFDMVFMDCQMPIMDGYQAAKEIRKLKKGKDIPIIALTANAMQEHKDKCIESGMNCFIPKPIELNRLKSTIKTIILAMN